MAMSNEDRIAARIEKLHREFSRVLADAEGIEAREAIAAIFGALGTVIVNTPSLKDRGLLIANARRLLDLTLDDAAKQASDLHDQGDVRVH